jgi:hypothetical protein
LTRPPIRIEHSPLERARLWIEIIAFGAAGCWAIYTFLYQTRIAPALLPAHENFSFKVERLASTASGSVAQVRLTIKNDGTVDVDTAALALNVYGASANGLRWGTIGTPTRVILREPVGGWKTLQAVGFLEAGAVGGKPGSHFLLRPGDSLDISVPLVVPSGDHLLRVYMNTTYARYPIQPPVLVRLVRAPDGTVDLSGNYPSTAFDSYFGI